jgi:hypothetical protein
MPRNHKSTGARVSKTATKAQALKSNAALEQAIENVQQNSASPPTRSLGAAAKTLDNAQEEVLIKWIRRVKELSAIPNATQITASANQIFSAGGTDTALSKACVNNFIKRLPVALTPSKKRTTKKKRVEASDLGLLKDWFARLEASIAGVSPTNIYNFDETIFQIGEGNRPVWSFCRADEPPPVYDGPSRYCEWITTLECVSADGWKGEPYLVIQGDHHLEEWFQVKGLSENAVLNLSPSGRVTDNAAYDWVQEFHNQTKDRVEEGQNRVLLFRGEAPFLTFNFLQFCDEHSIVPLCFPAKMGHLMQPFDAKPLEPFRQWWKNASHRIWSSPQKSADKEKSVFIKRYPKAREEHLNSEGIADAFAKQGISPFDPSKILTRVK